MITPVTETPDNNTTTDDLGVIRVASAPTGADRMRYGVELTLGDLLTWRLDGDQVMRYVSKAYTAAGIAEHSFAVFHLLTDQLGMERALAVQFMREDYRPPSGTVDACRADEVCPVDWMAAFNPRHPYIGIGYKGAVIGQMMPNDLRVHAGATLDASVASALDTALLGTLTEHVSLDADRARHFVNDLQYHWPFGGAPSERYVSPDAFSPFCSECGAPAGGTACSNCGTPFDQPVENVVDDL